MRILITRTDKIGDVVVSTPAVKALRHVFPKAFIAFMAEKPAFELLKDNPYIDEIIVSDKKGSEKNLAGFIKLILKLRKKKFDTAVILHPTVRVHLSCFLAGIPRRIGYDRKLGWLLTDRVRHIKQQGLKHEVEYNFDVLHRLGVNEKPSRPEIFISAAVESKVAALFKKAGIIQGLDLYALNPWASCSSKRWPIERFAEVAQWLLDQRNTGIVIIGDGNCQKAAGRLTASLKGNTYDLTGRTSLSELACVLSKCKALISNDSGPMHVGAAVGTKVVVVFGRKEPGLAPRRWAPYGEQHVVIQKDQGCQVCLAHNCKNNFGCLMSVEASEVIAALKNKTE
jgi:lipopolysaccharide heptosyltransferase II